MIRVPVQVRTGTGIVKMLESKIEFVKEEYESLNPDLSATETRISQKHLQTLL